MKLAALFLLALSLHAQAPPIRIAAGSSRPIIDSIGNVWSADTNPQGNTWSTNVKATGTPDPALYANCRWGTFTYSFTVPPGSYAVNLLFADPSAPAAGTRQFNVSINGATVLSNFDIVAASGAPMAAIVKAFPAIPVGADGELKIAFTRGSADEPMVNGIDIEPVLPAPTAQVFTLSFVYIGPLASVPPLPGPCPAPLKADQIPFQFDSAGFAYFCVRDVSGTSYRWMRTPRASLSPIW